MTEIRFEPTPEQEVVLKRLRKETGKTVGYLISKALDEILEDAEDLRIAEERAAEGNPTKPFEQVMKECGLDN